MLVGQNSQHKKITCPEIFERLSSANLKQKRDINIIVFLELCGEMEADKWQNDGFSTVKKEKVLQWY